MTLTDCPSCKRHVDVRASACPFCGAAPSALPRRRAARPGMTRAVLFTLGATVIGATGCGDSTETDAGAGTDAGPEMVDSGNIAMPYGAPPADHVIA